MAKSKSLLNQVKLNKNHVLAAAALLALAGIYLIYRANASGWVYAGKISSTVRAVDIGSGGHEEWVAGDNGQEYRHEADRWVDKPQGGAAVRVDVDFEGQPWKVVWNTGNVYYRKKADGEWRKVYSGAKDVGVSSSGRGYNLVGKDGCLYQTPGPYSVVTWKKISVPCNAANVDAYGGKVYWTNTSGIVYGGGYGSNGKFSFRSYGSTAMRDIAIGEGYRFWGVSTQKVGSNYVPYRWTGSKWEKKGGGVSRISIDKSGFPWAINSSGNIYYYPY